MRLILLLCGLLLLPSQAWAICRCGCVQGQMRAICLPTDLVTPICQGLCSEEIQPSSVVRPLAGGRRQYEPVEAFDPSQGGLQRRAQDLNLDPRGNQLGLAGVQSGTDSLSSSGTTGGAAGAAGAAGALGR